MIKYNDSHIYVGYIKQLLSSFNLPTCHVGLNEELKNSINEKSTSKIYYLDESSLYSYYYDKESNKFVNERLTAYYLGNYMQNLTKN